MAENKNKWFSLNHLLYNKKVIMGFSVLAAIVFWLVINITQNPIREQTIIDVPITVLTKGSAVSEIGLDIVGEYIKKADVTVSGPSYIISSLTAKDFQVVASLADVSAAGTYDLSLTASRAGTKVGYSIVGVTPDKISLTFDAIDTKKFDVVAVANGASATQGLLIDNAVVTDSEFTTLEVKGPRTEMQKIAVVQAVADVNKTLSVTESFDANIILLDKQGKEINKSLFTFKTDKIKVSVPVSKKKVVPVKPTFLNLPEAYAVNGVPCTLSYETITIIGPPEIVDAVSEIPLLPIDFENVTSTNKSFDVTLDLPNAVKTIDKIEFITVAFNFKNMSEKVFSISEFVPINLAGGLSVDLPSSIRNVKVCGPTSVLRRLNASDIFAEIDFSGKHVGEYTLVAKIRIKSNNEVWAIGSYNLIATVK